MSTETVGPRAADRRGRYAALTAIVGAGAFAAVTQLVPRAAIQDLDTAVLRALRRVDEPALPLGGQVVAEIARDVTSLGSVVVLLLVVVLVVAYLLVDRRTRDAVAVAVATLGGFAIDLALKWAFARARPDVVPQLVLVESGSFPSGHTMLSAVTYLTLGALLARFAKRRANQLLPVAAAATITFLVGCSRLVLGVHYPTDVLAGWAAGAAWAGLSWLAVDRLARKGAVEGRAPGPAEAAHES